MFDVKSAVHKLIRNASNVSKIIMFADAWKRVKNVPANLNYCEMSEIIAWLFKYEFFIFIHFSFIFTIISSHRIYFHPWFTFHLHHHHHLVSIYMSILILLQFIHLFYNFIHLIAITFIAKFHSHFFFST